MESLLKETVYWTFNDSWTNSSKAHGSRGLNQTVNPLKRNEEVAKVEVTVLVLILLLALAGNLCVLVAIQTSKHGQSRMYYFMKHLSIADLVVAVFQVLPQLIWDITFRFYGPDFLCRLVKYLQVVGMFASTYMLVLMSIDRCLAIWQPLRSLRRRKDRFFVLASWIISLLFSLPQVYIFSLREVGDGVFDCWGDFVQPWGAKAYVTWISLTIYIIPVAILSVCYGLISYKIWQNFKLKTRRDQCLSLTPRPAKGTALSRVSSVKLISKAKIRTVKMTFVIVLAYIICWTPFFFVQMWSAWDPMAPREAMAFIIAMLLASLNSCCNPWIYMFFAGHLFWDLMQRCLTASHCGCTRQWRSKSHSGTGAVRSTSSQKSVTQSSTA
ncbi:oxytocin receptor b [Puntigrus tetrazona]|uniref:oxytocin receptor b n=1 Tax=Puntigrus tetrazona TaxID=1606681 RepID=UPI001C8949B0|nr:oxytocin receptor b [Puntigrus tetrazona]